MGLLRRPFVVKVSYPGPDFAAGYDVHHPDYAGVIREAGSKSDGSVVKRTWPVEVLDPWNSVSYKRAVKTLANETKVARLRLERPASLDMTRKFVECRELRPISAWQLRATRKRWLPVRVVKDASSDIPNTGEAKLVSYSSVV